jgi:hypothetical protein
MDDSQSPAVFTALVADIEQRKRRGEITQEQAGAEFWEVLQDYVGSLPPEEAQEAIAKLALADLEFERQARELGLKVPGRDRTKLQ